MKTPVALLFALTFTGLGQQFAYVGNYDPSGVSVIDTTTNQVVAMVPIDGLIFHAQVSPDGSQVWAANVIHNRIGIFDTTTYTPILIDLPFSPNRIAFTPDGTLGYVATNAGVLALDARTYAIVGLIPGSDSFRLGMAFTADGRKLYVSQSNLDSISVIDTKTSKVTKTLTLPAHSDPRAITLSHKGDRIFVANEFSGMVSVFSTVDDTLLATIPVGVGPSLVVLTAADDKAYVTGFANSLLVTVDLATYTVVNTLPVIDPDEIAITPDGFRGYVTNAFEGTASVVDLAANQITGTIPIGIGPNTISMGSNAARLHIGLANSDDVGIRFDLRAEVYRNGTQLLASGELSSVFGGSSGFNNSLLLPVPLNLAVPLAASSGDNLSVRLLARNACSGSGKNSGRARLWYGDSDADSRFDAIVQGQRVSFYLHDASLTTSPGSGPKRSIDVQAGGKCSAFQPFGVWSTQLP